MSGGWTGIREALRPAQGWLKRRWAPTAAAAAILATTLGVVADLGSLIPGRGTLNAAEAEVLAADVAMHLEAQRVAHGGEYGGRDSLSAAARDLARTGDRRIAEGLRHLRSGEAAEAIGTLETAIARRADRHPAESSALYTDLGQIAETVDPERAARYFETAMTGDRADPGARDGLARLRLQMGDTDGAETLWHEARTRAEIAGDDRALARAEAGLGLVAATRAEFDAAHARYTAALEIYDLEGDLQASARQLGNLGFVAQGRGDDEAAERFYTRALTLMDTAGDTTGAAMARNNLAGFHRDRGDYDAAADAYRLSLSALEAAGDRPRTALVISNLGRLAEAQGDRDAAARFYDRALNRAREFRYVRVVEATARQAGWLAMEAQDFSTARHHADTALTANETLGDPQSRADALVLSAAVAGASGDPERAIREGEAALSIAGDYPGTEDVRAFVHGVLAAAWREGGDHAATERHTLQARDLFIAAGNGLGAGDQYNRLATLAFDRQDRTAACRHLDEAHRYYADAGSQEGAAAMQGRMEANGCGEGPG